METKVCSKCKIEKEILNFDKCISNKDGLYPSCKNCRKIYRNNNKENINKYYNDYYTSNLDRERNRKKEYRNNNKDKVKNSIKTSITKRKINDPLFNFSYKIRNNISNSLISKNDKINDILGCTPNEFKLHIESQFEPWMNWNNRGLYNGQVNYGWDIDHIIPMSTAKTEEDIIKLNHYTNLRPRCSYLNRVSDNKKYKTD